ncbi:MAG TPA: four helix bundle protein [Gemmatimonadales bacterium]|nr:four helix bundle protein [Gemmatimonadales bacterium]
MHKYRHLVAWQRARDVTLTVFREAHAHYHPRSRALLEQLRRAALSIDLNIVEGGALGSTPLFRRHVRIAIGSAAESQRLTELARELEYLPVETTTHLDRLLDDTLALLHGLLKRLNRT